MFDFIKNLFKKELEKAEVDLENLNNWFEERTSPVVDETNKNIKFKFDEFNVLLNTFKKNIEDLEKSEIKEPDKIQDKVKQVVLGHKDNYVKRLNQFLNLIKIPEESSFEAAVAFCSAADKALNEFSENTVKTFYTVQHLFGNEVDQVAKCNKRADNLVNDTKNLTENEKISKIREIKEKIQIFKDTKLKKGQLNLRFNEQQTKLKKLEKDKINTYDEIYKLEKSEEYSDYLSMKERLDGLNKSISDLKAEVIQLFSPLSASLKKFERITLDNEDLVKRYSEDPVSALFFDKELKIISLLEDMEKNILSNSLEIRDKKKEKVIEKIKLVQQDRLSQITSRHSALQNEKDLMLKKIKVNSAWLKNDELKYKLEHIENSLKVYTEASEELNKKIEETDLNKLKTELENKIKELTNVEVLINVSL